MDESLILLNNISRLNIPYEKYTYLTGKANNGVEIIVNEQGNRTTPSCVSFTDTQRMVGDAAKDKAALNPTNTVFDLSKSINPDEAVANGAAIQAAKQYLVVKAVRRRYME
ncbi:heat shock 70 kDa protein 18-like [Senna tora]|uniref:Heat shock 70 kDa protein 18-like n=1 Tax=Senna tora TaxID=362788 RepID=A0A834SX23_9FABA|nr:heat shock 70 kDa protein 18-like [Senna tora]